MERSTRATREIHFRDRRPPHAIQSTLERRWMVLLQPFQDQGRLAYRAKAKIIGAPYSFLLRFEAALPRINCYYFRMDVSWGAMSAENHDYFRKTSASWFDYWTEGFKSAKPTLEAEGSAERYRSVVEQTLAAEAHLNSVSAVQQEILTAMRGGAYFRTAHKEGGTTIACVSGQFQRQDYGESDDHRVFPDEAVFLAFLRQFYSSEVSRNNYPDDLSEYAAWKLILRQIERP